MKRLFSLIAILAVVCSFSFAQIVTSSPLLIQDKSQNVTLTYHADSPLGNGGLKDLPSSTPVYAHIGVITNKSINTSDWKYAPTWGDNADKYKLTYVSANTYTLNIGNMRSYFGITDASEVIEKIALVFRTGDKSKEGKTKAGGDIFVDIYPDGYQLLLTTDAPGIIVTEATTVNLTAATTEASEITISVNGTILAQASGKTEMTASYKISSIGSYTFTATASANGQVLSKSTTISYPGNSEAGTYPGGVPQMGAVKNADGTVTFCLAAPGKQSVILVPSWDNYSVLDKNIMKYQDYNGQRYFFTTVSGLSDNEWYPYYYIVDGLTKVGDPYARLVLDNYSDKWLDNSLWPDMPKYPYDDFDDTMLAVYHGSIDTNYKFSDFTIPDHRNLVIYEMLFRDFTGTEGAANANGTIRDAIEKIPYLKALGVNAVELMPVMEFNGNNSWGYNTNFYMAPDKAYGSPNDLKDFIELCHVNGMAVILDIVFNQSDGLHPWYQMYPISSNPFYNEKAPHDYSVLNDWKQENPILRQYWKDVITYWMTAYNVDGFRFDLVKGLGTSYPSGTEAYNASRIAVMKDLHSAITAVKPNGIHINENLAGSQEENEMAADGQLNWANVNNSSCQYVMGWASDSGLGRFLSTSDSRTAFSTVAYAESHDEQRMGYKQIKYGYENDDQTISIKTDAALRAKRLQQLAVQLLATPGPKMIWQFGELGDCQTTKNVDEKGNESGNNTDPKKVLWNSLEDPNLKGIHDVYAAMANLRTHNEDLFINGTYWQSGVASANFNTNRVMIIKKDQQQVLVVINPALSGEKTISVSTSRCNLITPDSHQLICATPGFNPTLTQSGTSLRVTVPANSFAVFATKEVSDVDDTMGDNLVANKLNVYSDSGRIIVEGEYNYAKVYSITGQLYGSLDVPAGIYIVEIDGNIYKVAVR